jgi:transketolase
LRFGRPKVANFTTDDIPFEIGKGIVLKPGKDVTIAATGHLVWEALQAADAMEAKGISAEVINIHTIKPLDTELLISSVQKTGCIVSAEEHNYLGGLGESVAGALARNHPTPQEFVATKDTFGESGTPAQLMEKYGLNNNSIIVACKKAISRK